jgi:hypothetical protein
MEFGVLPMRFLGEKILIDIYFILETHLLTANHLEEIILIAAAEDNGLRCIR